MDKRDSVRLEMVAMAVVMPSQNSCIVASTYEVPCAYRALVKPISLQSVAASRRSRNGNGRTAVFSSGGVLSKEIPVCSSDIRSRVGFRTDIGPQSSADNNCSSSSESRLQLIPDSSCHHGRPRTVRSFFRCNCASHESQETVENEDSTSDADQESKVDAEQDSSSAGVAIAIKMLKFYKREISPILPGSCRFVPTCSEYGMQAFKKYGVLKGAILTAWRLSRCNPLGGSGFDPPRWFDEPRPPPY